VFVYGLWARGSSVAKNTPTKSALVYKSRPCHPPAVTQTRHHYKADRKEEVVSFRIPTSIAQNLQKWLQESPEGIDQSLSQYARSLFLQALGHRAVSAVFKSTIVDTIPDYAVVQGDAKDTLRQMNDESVDSVITSPPYWHQKDYGHRDQIGQEDTPDQYVQRLVEVFREARRVMKRTGTLWIILGDAYLKKQLLGLPWRLALALQQKGFWLRSEIVWSKPGVKPEGVSDRPTRSHETVFLFTKLADGYFYSADAIREPHTTSWALDCINKAAEQGLSGRPRNDPFSKEARRANGHRGITRAEYGLLMNPLGRNRRSVWTVNTGKFNGAHYAAAPEELVSLCIRAGCPEGGLVVDPFAGAGTTGLAAVSLGRKFLGVDLVPDYVEMATRRITARALDATASQHVQRTQTPVPVLPN